MPPTSPFGGDGRSDKGHIARPAASPTTTKATTGFGSVQGEPIMSVRARYWTKRRYAAFPPGCARRTFVGDGSSAYQEGDALPPAVGNSDSRGQTVANRLFMAFRQVPDRLLRPGGKPGS